MAKWPIKRLDSLCDVTSSKRVYAKDLCAAGVPFYRSTEIIEKLSGQPTPSNPLFISEEHFHKLIETVGAPLAGDLLLTSRGTLGVPYIVKATDRFHFADGNLTWFRKFKELNSHFLKYFLLSPSGKAELKRCVIGSSQPAYTISSLKNIVMSLPPLPTQNRIASILSVYDDLIENNTRRIKILEEMAQRLYREWFVNFRFPGHEKVRMVESDLGPIPQGWEPKRLGDQCVETRRGVNPGEIDPETPYIGLEHMPRKSIALAEWGKAGDVGSTKLRFSKGEILFGKIRPYFHKVGVALVDGVASSDAIVIVPKSQDNFAAVLCCVSSDDFVRHATQTSQGTKMPRANWTVLTKYPLPVPPAALLNRFNDVVRPLIGLVDNLSLRNRNLRTTRDLLLPKLISGEIPVEAAEEAMEQTA